MKNDRTYPRIEKNLLVVVTGRLGAVIGNTFDISESGLRLSRIEAGFSLGQEVRLTLSAADKTLVTRARVVRADDDNVAFRFEQSLNDETLAQVVAA